MSEYIKPIVICELEDFERFKEIQVNVPRCYEVLSAVATNDNISVYLRCQTKGERQNLTIIALESYDRIPIGARVTCV